MTSPSCPRERSARRASSVGGPCRDNREKRPGSEFPSALQLPVEQVVHDLWTRLSLGRLHHLSNKKSFYRLLACPELLHLLRIRRHHLVDCLFDRRGIRNLLRLLRFVHGREVLVSRERQV